MGLKDVIEKIENFIKELRKKIKNQENKIWSWHPHILKDNSKIFYGQHNILSEEAK